MLLFTFPAEEKLPDEAVHHGYLHNRGDVPYAFDLGLGYTRTRRSWRQMLGTGLRTYRAASRYDYLDLHERLEIAVNRDVYYNMWTIALCLLVEKQTRAH